MGLLQTSSLAILLGAISLAASEGIRLPQTFLPSDASLEIDFDDNKLTYTGSVKINGTFNAAANEIVLHADTSYLDITLTDIAVEELAYNAWHTRTATTTVNTTNQFLTITIAESITVGNTYRVSIPFKTETSISDDENRGVFYKKLSGGYVIGTAFYPIKARTVFPCFDEPAFLVSYSMVISHHRSYTLHANTPIVHTESHGIFARSVTETLAATPQIPASQLGFYLVEGFSKADQSSPGTQIFMGPKITQTGNVLEHFTDTSLLDIWVRDQPNITVLVIPGLSGNIYSSYNLIAMDSYYAEDREDTSSEQTIQILSSIVNAVARQAFGSRLSISWWDDAWILESFPIFLANSIIEKDPTWGPVYEALKAKNLPSILNIGMSVEKTITTASGIHMSVKCHAKYKGAVILSMFDRAMPSDNKMIDVIKTFLKRTDGGAADTASFVSTLSTALRGDLAQSTEELGKWWTNHCVPTVSVTLDSITEMPVSGDCSNDVQLTIPVAFVTSDNGTEQYEVISSEQPYSFDRLDWVIPNSAAAGLYRVQYQQDASDALMGALPSGSPSALQRAQAMADSFWGASTDRLDFYDVLNLTNYMNNEYEPAPWSVAADLYKSLGVYIASNETAFEKYKNRVQAEVKDLYEEITSRTSSPGQLGDLWEGLIVSLACDMELNECLTMAKNLFKAKDGDSEAEFRDMYSTINCYGIQGEWSNKDWHNGYSTWKSYAQSIPALWSFYLDQLVCYGDTVFMLNDTLKNNKGDMVEVFSSVLKRSEHVDYSLDWFVSNYEVLSTKMTEEEWSSMIESLGDVLGTKAQYDKLNELSAEVKPDSPFAMSLAEALKSVNERQSYISEMIYNWNNWIFRSAPDPKVLPTSTVTPTSTTTQKITTTMNPSSKTPMSSTTPSGSSTTPVPGSSTTTAPPTTPHGGGASGITLSVSALLASLGLFYVR